MNKYVVTIEDKNSEEGVRTITGVDSVISSVLPDRVLIETESKNYMIKLKDSEELIIHKVVNDE